MASRLATTYAIFPTLPFGCGCYNAPLASRNRCSLESATVSAYDCAEHLDGSGRKQVLAVVQMIEIAQLWVNTALERECPVN